MKKTVQIAMLLSMLAFSSCSSRLQKNMRMPEIPAWETTGRIVDTGSTQAPHQLFVDKFSDARPSEIIVRRGAEEVIASGEVGVSVGSALEKAFRSRGFSVSQTAPVVISGEIRAWQSEITKGFPSQKLQANAEVFIEVLDPANKRIYSGTYKGSASREDPSLNEEDIRGNLGTAMSEALSQVTSDKQLIDLLMSF